MKNETGKWKLDLKGKRPANFFHHHQTVSGYSYRSWLESHATHHVLTVLWQPIRRNYSNHTRMLARVLGGSDFTSNPPKLLRRFVFSFFHSCCSLSFTDFISNLSQLLERFFNSCWILFFFFVIIYAATTIGGKTAEPWTGTESIRVGMRSRGWKLRRHSHKRLVTRLIPTGTFLCSFLAVITAGKRNGPEKVPWRDSHDVR